MIMDFLLFQMRYRLCFLIISSILAVIWTVKHHISLQEYTYKEENYFP